MGVAEPLKAVAIAATEDPAAVSLDIQQWRRRGVPDGDLAAENFGAEDKAEAEKRFAIIEPLFFPNRFPEIWRECAGRKLAVVSNLATKHGCKARTIRRWAMQYKRHGVQGLVNPSFSNSSTTPATRGASGPTIVRSARSRFAKPTMAFVCVRSMGTHSASCAMPAFPGAQ